MKTSAAQFQLLVDYMEKYGDLSKPSDGPHGRVRNLQLWVQLTRMLNADATGDTKTSDKWRKVWSDLKNNTKKKAARLMRSARGTGGGPASNLKLTDLEQKVLAIVGPQAATGIVCIPEVGLQVDITEIPPPTPTHVEGVNLDEQQDTHNTTMEDWNRPGTSSCSPVFPPTSYPAEVSRVPDQTSQPLVGRRQTGPTGGGMPPAASPAPTFRLQSPPSTPRRRRRRRMQNILSPNQRRTRTQTQSDMARQAFVRSDCEWRAFQHEAERERTRLREMELQMQQRWLDLFGQFLILVNRIVNILENK